MEHDDATVGRIFTRREALRAAARSGLGFALIGGAQRFASASPASDPQPKVHLVASPILTEGPFFVDENLKRSDLVAGTTRPSVKNGIPLYLTFTLYKLTGTNHTLLQDAH